MGGQRIRPGVHVLPDWLFPYLPKSSVVIVPPDKGQPVEELAAEKIEHLRDYDIERADDVVQEVHNAAMKQVELMNAARRRKAAMKAAEKLNISAGID